MNGAPLRLGTRKSPMAMAQARRVAGLITERTGRPVEFLPVTTFGDVSRAELAQIGGTGVFVSGLRACLLHDEIDLAVHSLKDLPASPVDGITLAAVTQRDDPRDSLVARDGAKLADLPAGSRIGTGSPRRAAQLLLLRPDLRPVPVRGNAARSRWNAAPAGPTWPACWPARMTRRATRRPPRSGACSPRSRPAAAPRSARMLPERKHCGCTPWWPQPAGAKRSGHAQPARPPGPPASAGRWPPSCCGAAPDG